MNNPPAFPTNDTPQIKEGMTLRDYFAAAALQGWLASMVGEEYTVDSVDVHFISKFTFEIADAMLKAREQ